MTEKDLRYLPHKLLAWLVFVALVGVYGILARYYPVAFAWLTFEDLYNEWAEVFLLLATMVLAVRLAAGPYRYRWFFGFIALACLFVAGEEISWGQRLLGFDTPEFFRTHNLQAEPNIHNLLTGPYATTLEGVIAYLLGGALVLYGLVYPATLGREWKPAVWTNHRLRIAAPPLYLWPFFVTAAWLELTPLNLNDNEVAEILVTLALALMTLQYWSTRHHESSPLVADQAGGSRLAIRMLVLLVSSMLFSLVIVSQVTLSEANRAEKERRVTISLKDFALHHESHEWWHSAIDIYTTIARKQPYNSEILRYIAKIHRQLGNEAEFANYSEKSVKVAGIVYARNPGEISAILNLARAYQQQGDTAKAGTLAKHAYLLAKSRVGKAPNDARARYWLGEAYLQGGYYGRALEEYRKAYELEPAKYRRAYLDLQLQMESGDVEKEPSQ